MKRWVRSRGTRLWRVVGLGLTLALLLLTAASAQAAPLPAGDPEQGKGYFTGSRPLQNGGPACLACHGIAGIGDLGGGALGPDLSKVATYTDPTAYALAILDSPGLTMRPIFGATHPLTPQEKADLAAFMAQAPVTERPAAVVAQLAGLAAAGTVVVFVLAHLLWRGRLVAVRRPLLGPGI
ncbi:MAG: c-type cytochrome [Chloroflexi bacterium]|nr:c-type cytochrome [Chloroflexota bacterium]